MFLARSGAIDGYEKLVAEYGGNPVLLMTGLGLSPAQFRNPNTLVSYSKLAELLENTAASCNNPLFGLILAGRQTSTVLGDLPMLLSQQASVMDAFTEINNYLYLHARGVRLRQQPRGGDVQLELVFDISSPRGLNQIIQMSIGQLANFTTDLLGLEKHSLPLFLRQQAPEQKARGPGASLHSRIYFGADIDGVRIPAAWLDKKPQRDEHALRIHLQNHLQQLQRRYPDNLQDQVRDFIGRSLPSGECTIDRVALMLDMHPRVLQKRLKKQGSSYSKLLQETRRDIAEQHLRHASMSVTDLALHLGYADASVFSRNFKRWFGASPRQWQREQAWR